ncbi:type II secretion system secretin GspD [Pseudorhodoferax sp. LjRoot39]|uniref:type II secretion system secretin GspD n=1 Tax=Pseudorhodoferax sp. LjRoot39 TaxID=3342328 RepID=UPI003ED1641F
MHSFLNRRPARPTRRACALAAALLCNALPALAQLPPAPQAPQAGMPAGAAPAPGGPSTVSLVPSGPRRGDPVTLNFMNADIEAVARTMATITGRNVVVDPRVKGTMNLSTDQPVPPSVAYSQFIAALRMQGFTVVDAAGLDKVVPEADAKLQSSPVSISEGGDGGLPSGSQIVTQIFRLNHESANNLVPVLRPLISPNNTINANPGTNSLVITDYADNLRRLGRVIAAMDVSNATDVEVIPLRHAIASDLAPLVARLVEPGSSTGGAAAPAAGQAADTSYRTTLMAEPRSNALVVRASNAARMNLIRSLVARLDQPPAPGSSAASGNIHVVYLKNADAVKLAATLRAAIAAGNTGGTGTQGGGSSPSSGASNLGTMQTSFGANTSSSGSSGSGSVSGFGGSSTGGGNLNQGNSNQPSTGGQIQADPSTNSLIISAPEPQYRQLRAVIDRLDGRRAQVLVESLIVEVNAEKAAEFGIQWSALLGGKNLAALGTNFSVGGRNIFSIAPGLLNGSGTTTTGQTALPSTGGNLGYIYQKNGNNVLGFLARFLETNTDGNILSTPNLLTLDNEEARIIIGENVPFVTGSYTNATSTGSGTVNPFQTYERQDVGLTLRVRPQINENGTVKMVIYQESSAVKSGTESAASGPTTTKRAIESTVLVDDGSIVVLGGLLQDQYGGNQEKVPGVGDIPFFGNLFKSEARSRRKTNLMVFLRPVVVRDNQAAESLSMDRYDLMRVGQQQAQPQESSLVRVNEAPVLPEQPLRRLTPAAATMPAPLLPPSTNLQTQTPGAPSQPVTTPQ